MAAPVGARSRPGGALDSVGNRALVGREAVGVSGSRGAGERALALAARFGEAVAGLGLVLVSGNARGVDDAAQYGALRAGGDVVSVLAEGLAGWRPRARYRGLLRPGDAPDNYAAVSEFGRDEGWGAWRAMRRNRTVIDLSLAFVVVQAGVSGGTWEGGLECLRRGRPLLVADPRELPGAEGNARLVARGGEPVTPDTLAALLERARLRGGLANGAQLPLAAGEPARYEPSAPSASHSR